MPSETAWTNISIFTDFYIPIGVLWKAKVDWKGQSFADKVKIKTGLHTCREPNSSVSLASSKKTVISEINLPKHNQKKYSGLPRLTVFSFQKKFKVDFWTDGPEYISAHMQTPSVSYAQNLYRTALRHFWNTPKQLAAKKMKLNGTSSAHVDTSKGSIQSNKKLRKLFPRDCRIQHSSFHLLSSRQPCNT